MSNNTVASIYSGVIKDVIANVRKDFEDSGIEETVLYQLERIWENKIRSAKVAPWEANGLASEDPNQNGLSNANIYSQHPPPPPSDPAGIKYLEQPAAASLVSRVVPNMHTNHNNDIGATLMKKYPIQPSQTLSAPITPDMSNRSSSVTPINSQVVNVSPNISPVDQKIYHNQLLGRGQQELNLGHMSEKLIPRDLREASSNSSPQQLPEFETQVEPSFADNDDINSDLDDSEDDDANADNEETQNIILCLYDKVTRTKNKWKCQLKDGIVSVNGRDYLFQKGNGDFEF